MFTTKSLLGLAGASILAVAAVAAHAYEFNPMVMELKPSGSGSSSNGTITNTHPEPIAIELQVFKRIQRPDGTDELIPENQDFIVTPPQMVIQPNESQAFRVQWVGDPNPNQELAYRLVSDQLPINFRSESRNDYTTEVSMRYRYEGALYVQPNSTRPNAQLEGARVVSGDGSAGNMVELTIRSVGTRRAILDNPSVELSSGSTSVTLAGEQVGALSGLNILPGSTRVVQFPAPAGLPVGEVSGKLSTSYVVIN